MAKQTCENCAYCARDYSDLICVNINSEYVADYVEKNHTCDDWEGKTKEQIIKFGMQFSGRTKKLFH